MTSPAADILRLELPAKAEYTGSLRLFVAGLAARIGFDVERTEDIKLVAGEMIVMAIKDENAAFTLTCTVTEDTLHLEANADRDAKDDMSVKIMQALSDEVICTEGSVRASFRRDA